jgi:hypothetical protein
MSTFSPVGSLLPDSLKQHKIEMATDRYTALQLWEEVLTGFLNKAADKTKAIDLHDGTLIVACLDEILAKEINGFLPMLTDALNRLAGKNIIKNIRIET